MLIDRLNVNRYVKYNNNNDNNNSLSMVPCKKNPKKAEKNSLQVE